MFDIRPHRTPEPSAPVFRCGQIRSGRPLLRSGRASNESGQSGTLAGTSPWGSGNIFGSGLLAAAMLAGCAGSAAAQAAGAGGVEVLGVRAQGMAGAFVAVADDATAAYWNPAGLGTGDFVSLALERSHVSLPSVDGVTPRVTDRRRPHRHPAARRRLLPPRRHARGAGDAGPVHRRPPERRRGGQGRLERGDRRTDARPPGRRPGRDGPHRRLAGRAGPPQPRRADLRSGGRSPSTGTATGSNATPAWASRCSRATA